MGHGSQYHRGVGSLGTMLPMRVLPGKKMPGQMGGDKVTIQNLEIIQIDLENNVILIKGNVPGPKKSLVLVKSAVKKGSTKNEKIELITFEEPQKTAETTEEISSQETTEEVSE